MGVDGLIKLAHQGDTEAQFLLGIAYLKGDGVEKDPEQAEHWWQLSINNGNTYPISAELQYKLGLLYAEELKYDRAKICYERTAEQNHIYALTNLGQCLYHGWGCARDCREALACFRGAATQGDPLAEHNIGLMYYFGRGGVARKRYRGQCIVDRG